MQRELKHLKNYKVHTEQEEIGKVKDFYFDDKLWALRYLVVNTGNFLFKNLVLISAISILDIDEEEQIITLNIDKKEVEASPDIDFARPISRQAEIEVARHYNLNYYWTGFNTWGHYPIPVKLRNYDEQNPAPEISVSEEETHLRSLKEVLGYNLEAKDGHLGKISDLVISDTNFEVNYFMVDLAGTLEKTELDIHVKWIKKISYPENNIYLNLYKKEMFRIKEAGGVLV